MTITEKWNICSFIVKQMQARHVPVFLLIAFDTSGWITCHELLAIRQWLAGVDQRYIPTRKVVRMLVKAFAALSTQYPLPG